MCLSAGSRGEECAVLQAPERSGPSDDDVGHLLAAAAQLPDHGPRIDVDDPALIPPGGMRERIAAAGDHRELAPAQTVRCSLDSLAAGYAGTVHQAADLARRSTCGGSHEAGLRPLVSSVTYASWAAY